MPGGPSKLFVDLVCPRCGKRYHGEILKEDMPAKRGKYYVMRCWKCHAAGKPQWVKDWVQNQKNWERE
jgi:uncharacterized Zn finger protein